MKEANDFKSDRSSFTITAAAGRIYVLFLLYLLILAISILRGQRDAETRAGDRALAGSQVVATNARWIAELSHCRRNHITSNVRIMSGDSFE